MIDHEEIFNLSYWRVIQGQVDGVPFIDGFYDRFLACSPEIANKFANTDFDKQKRMLLLSMIHVASYFASGESGQVLEDLARKHSQKELDIEPHLYDYWLESLLSTVENYDPEFNEDVRESWRTVLTPGMEYMKSQYTE